MGNPPSWGEQGARSCYQEVLQALGTASSSAQPFITSPRGCYGRGLINFYTQLSAGLGAIVHYSGVQ